MDLNTEVVFSEQGQEVLRDRFELPIFFIVGGADDLYHSRLIGSPIWDIVCGKTVDTPIQEPMGVYASRALLLTSGLARTFPISVFLNSEWPILDNIERDEKDTKTPTNVEKTWVIRALRRMGRDDIANKVRNNMLSKIYPEKLGSDYIPTTNAETLNSILSDEQKNYPLIILVDDLPIQLSTTIGDILKILSLGGPADEKNQRALQTSIQLLQVSSK